MRIPLKTRQTAVERTRGLARYPTLGWTAVRARAAYAPPRGMAQSLQSVYFLYSELRQYNTFGIIGNR